MANKKKKKHAKAKKFAGHRAATKKKVAKKKTLPKKAAPKKTALKKMKVKVRGKSQNVNTVAYETEGLGPRSGGQSGDLQGVSNIERADSESVDELLDEGNAFEAEVVKGVQDAGDAIGGEVRTGRKMTFRGSI